MIETLLLNVRLPNGTLEKREITLVPGLELKVDSAGGLTVSSLPGASVQVTPPSHPNSTGVKGTFSYDSNYFYACVATNTWVRAPLASW